MGTQSKYMNPYLAGFFLGLVVLATVFLTGRGLGASGAIKSAVVASVDIVSPEHVQSRPFFQQAMESSDGHPMKTWLVFEVLGVIAGGFISGLISNRLKFTTEKGPGISDRKRWVFAVIGGALFGIGAQLARGCTSGAALTGMAVLSTAGFLTTMAIFGGGYMFAYFARRLWI